MWHQSQKNWGRDFLLHPTVKSLFSVSYCLLPRKTNRSSQLFSACSSALFFILSKNWSLRSPGWSHSSDSHRPVYFLPDFSLTSFLFCSVGMWTHWRRGLWLCVPVTHDCGLQTLFTVSQISPHALQLKMFVIPGMTSEIKVAMRILYFHGIEICDFSAYLMEVSFLFHTNAIEPCNKYAFLFTYG